jgi:hypothetical protein
VGEFRRARSPRRQHPGRAQGAARANNNVPIVVAEVIRLSDDQRRPFGSTLKHGRGQETANTSPTRTGKLVWRSGPIHDGHDGEPDETNQPTIVVLIALPDTLCLF